MHVQLLVCKDGKPRNVQVLKCLIEQFFVGFDFRFILFYSLFFFSSFLSLNEMCYFKRVQCIIAIDWVEWEKLNAHIFTLIKIVVAPLWTLERKQNILKMRHERRNPIFDSLYAHTLNIFMNFMVLILFSA